MPRPSPMLRREPSGNGSPRPSSGADRLANLEAAVASIQQTLDVQFKRIATMQAELDHLAVKNRNS